MPQQALKSEDISDCTTALETTSEKPQKKNKPLEKTEDTCPTVNSWAYMDSLLSQFRHTGFPVINQSDEITKIGRDTADAMTKSGTALAQGLEEIGRHLLTLTHNSFSANLATHREAFAVRTLQDVFELQSKWVSRFMNATVSETTRISELSMKVSGQVTEPIHAHIRTTLGKINTYF